jgi:hypothetical protein
VVLGGTVMAYVDDDAYVNMFGNASAYLNGHSCATLHDNSHVDLNLHATATLYDDSTINTFDLCSETQITDRRFRSKYTIKELIQKLDMWFNVLMFSYCYIFCFCIIGSALYFSDMERKYAGVAIISILPAILLFLLLVILNKINNKE